MGLLNRFLLMILILSGYLQAQFYDYTDVLINIENLLEDDRDSSVIIIYKRVIDSVVQVIEEGVKNSDIGENDLFKLSMVMDGFRYRLEDLIEFGSDYDIQNSYEELLVRGLRIIGQNVVCIAIEGDKMVGHVSDILNGIYMVARYFVANGDLPNDKNLNVLFKPILRFDPFSVVGAMY